MLQGQHPCFTRPRQVFQFAGNPWKRQSTVFQNMKCHPTGLQNWPGAHHDPCQPRWPLMPVQWQMTFFSSPFAWRSSSQRFLTRPSMSQKWNLADNKGATVTPHLGNKSTPSPRRPPLSACISFLSVFHIARVPPAQPTGTQCSASLPFRAPLITSQRIPPTPPSEGASYHRNGDLDDSSSQLSLGSRFLRHQPR